MPGEILSCQAVMVNCKEQMMDILQREWRSNALECQIGLQARISILFTEYPSCSNRPWTTVHTLKTSIYDTPDLCPHAHMECQ